MPNHVISRVELLAAKEGFTPLVEPIFRTYALSAGVDDEDEEPDEETEGDEDDALGAGVDEDDDYHPDPDMPRLRTTVQDEDEQSADADDADDNDQEDPAVPEEPDEYDEPDPDGEPIPTLPRRSARTPKPRSILDLSSSGQTYESAEVKTYATPAINHMITQAKPTNIFEYETEEAHILASAFAQTYSLVKGLKKFGSAGEEAVYEEIEQLHNRGCFKPIHIESYGSASRQQVMGSIMFLTEKRDGTIKARNVTDGRKQRTWMSKEEAASPTVMLESLLLTAIIDAKENRDVCVVDIPHAFVQTPNER
jgi:hypothetical protein